METISATIRDTPVRFKISPAFAENCTPGEIVVHKALGPLLVEESRVDTDGNRQNVVFFGTSSRKQASLLRSNRA